MNKEVKNNNINYKFRLPPTFYKYLGSHHLSLDTTEPNIRKFMRKWYGMKERCYYEYSPRYKYYGMRGIKICEEWHDVEKFVKWCLKTYPQDGKRYSIDRKDVNGDYSPENCKWATAKEQANNRRNNVVYRGKTLSQWAETLGCKETTINRRLHVMGWDIEKAVTTPVKKKGTR